jgi:glycogen operon protein
MGYRLTGSSDLYQGDGRRPYASINFVTAHDGFTLRDLVSYNDKHNEPNGEENRDGTDDNRSWNCGVEGDTDDPEVNGLRRSQKRNFLTTLLLSQGVPMLLGGDEMDRTQRGNNNAYCQDNELTWFDWDLDEDQQDLLEFIRRVIALRRDHPVFRRRSFFQGRPIHGSGLADIGWFDPDGHEMTEQMWLSGRVSALGMFLNGEEIAEPGPRGERVVDDSFLVLLNGGSEAVAFQLPDAKWAESYELLLDTSIGYAAAHPVGLVEGVILKGGDELDLEARSVIVLRKTG